MIKILLYLLKNVPYRTKQLDIARGYYKYPETWSEFKRYLKFKING